MGNCQSPRKKSSLCPGEKISISPYLCKTGKSKTDEVPSIGEKKQNKKKTLSPGTDPSSHKIDWSHIQFTKMQEKSFNNKLNSINNKNYASDTYVESH